MEKIESPITEKGYWGNTTPEQDEALRKVKENIKDVITDRYDDARVLRFLRARGFDVDAAVQMLREDIRWRIENKVDDILPSFTQTPLGRELVDFWPNHLHKTDKYGLPLMVDRLAQLDPKTLIPSVSESVLNQVSLYCMERAEHAVDEASKKAGRPMDFGIIWILDLTDLGFKHMYTPALNILKVSIDNQKNHYPELIRKLLIVECPRIFSMFWVIFKPLMDARTVEKTEIHSSHDYTKYLKANMDPQSIPDIFGGDCTDHRPNKCIPGGGIFKSAVKIEDAPNEVTIKARSAFEHVVQVEHASSSIALEFKILHNDIKFKLFHKKSPTEVKEVVSAKVSSSESYQNTINVADAGTYILQWDNTHALMKSKQVSYRIEILAPLEQDQKAISSDELASNQN